LPPIPKLLKPFAVRTTSNNATGEAVNHHRGWLESARCRALDAAGAWRSGSGMKERHAMLAFFRDLERLTYSMVIRRETDSRRITRLESSPRYRAGASLWHPASPLQLTADEQQDTYDVLNGDFYLLVKSSTARKASAKTGFPHCQCRRTLRPSIISVEHVLPQTPAPGGEWMTWFPTLELRRRWTHRLGNLALLTKSKNSAACNYSFLTKKDKYFKHRGVSTLALTVQVLNHPQWTPDIVQARHRMLLKILEKHWRLEHRGFAAQRRAGVAHTSNNIRRGGSPALTGCPSVIC